MATKKKAPAKKAPAKKAAPAKKVVKKAAPAKKAPAKKVVKKAAPAKKAPAKKAVKPRSTSTPAKPLPKTAKGKANYGKYGTRDEYLFEKNAPAPKMSRWDANAPKPRAPKKPKAK
jgi:hypothetical protein